MKFIHMNHLYSTSSRKTPQRRKWWYGADWGGKSNTNISGCTKPSKTL